MKKVAWTGLVAVLTGVSAAAALRLADRLWRMFLHEPPPEMPRVARLLVAKPVHQRVQHRLGAPSL